MVRRIVGEAERPDSAVATLFSIRNLPDLLAADTEQCDIRVVIVPEETFGDVVAAWIASLGDSGCAGSLDPTRCQAKRTNEMPALAGGGVNCTCSSTG